MAIDFRKCLYALSDVIINRPPPLRAFDQIYMKIPDMLLQAELLGRWFADKRIVFVGDGDAVALAYVHLTKLDLLPGAPQAVTVVDFDERVVNSVNHFADRHELQAVIRAELYNVIDPLPESQWQQYDGFYTNPPWGASNEGRSVVHFCSRGVEACRTIARGCIVIGDHHSFPWTHRVQHVTQTMLLGRGFRVAEMLPEFHKYHLDDSPELTSCSMLVERDDASASTYDSKALPTSEWPNFYGMNDPAKYRYVKDLTNGGKFMSNDVELEPFDEKPTT
jgi:predicted methyltransferase